MPNLPLPTGEVDLAGGDLPVSSEEDTLAEFPRPIRNPESAPVRDAFIAAWTEGFLKYQSVASYAAAQRDPLRATGNYLLSFADEREIVPKPGESEEELRGRLFKAPSIVTPQAIVDGINEILAPVTDETCRLLELDLDGVFSRAVADATSASLWQSFSGAGPNYPDRYYAENPAYAPRGAYPSRGLPRSFHIQVPRFSTTEDDFPFVFAVNRSSGPFALSTNLPGAFFVFQDPQAADAIYSRIVAFVERIKGQGISWSLTVM